MPSESELSNEFFIPEKLDEYMLCRGKGRIVFDENAYTLRYLDHPLDSTSVRTVTDFFFVSDSVGVSSVSVLPMRFRSSDHDPVILHAVL